MQPVETEVETMSDWIKYLASVYLSYFGVITEETKSYHGVYFELDAIHYIRWLACGLEELGSFSLIGQQNLPCSTRPFWLPSHARYSGVTGGYFNGERDGRALKLTAHLQLGPSQRMRGGIPLLHCNQKQYLLHFITKKV